ncbi:MAG: YfgM family protein [Halioglobus sp.]
MRSEEEQVEALRQWWKENGTGIVTAVLLSIAGGFGWQAWQANQLASAEAASNGYQAMMRAVDSGEDSQRAQAIEIANNLKSEHASTTYAQYAALHLAALAVADEKLEDAEAELRWVLAKADKGSDNAIVAQSRLARVVASQGDFEQALALLSSADAGNFAASYAVARGDILYQRGDLNAARTAYNEALLLASVGGTPVNAPSLQQKIQSLSKVADPVQSGVDAGLFEADATQDTISAEPLAESVEEAAKEVAEQIDNEVPAS